ncbi:MAG: hypothetical protein U0T82_16435, partial [Bacteroidales bacterium]
MRTVKIAVERTKEFLAERLVNNLLQESEESLTRLVRYESLGGFEKMSDEEIFHQLAQIFPEFNLLKLVDSLPGFMIVGVKEETMEQEDEILVDISRIIQMKF